MLKLTHTRIIASIRKHVPSLLVTVCIVAGCSAPAWAITPGTQSALTRSEVTFPALDAKHLFALGMIETGNNDWVVGSAGEVSRYQLMPIVWKSYSKSADYQNPRVSLQVARAHWFYLASYFKGKTGRMPDDFDMYVLWNTKFGYYAHKGFSKRLLAPVVRDRAQRFVNLVNRKD